MSKQTGIIKLEGNLGGISFYKSDGKHLARVAAGPSKERIATDANFRRTRENNKEFGGSAKAGRALRLSMGQLLQTMASSRLTAKLTAVFKSINLKATTGTRGKRPITLSANRAMLKNIEFNDKQSLSTVFTAPYTNVINAARNATTTTIPAFTPDANIKAPAGATHFRLISAIGVVSDYLHNDGTNSYEAASPTLDTLGVSTASAILPLNTATTALTLTATLPGGPTMDAQSSVIQAIGIEFYQQVGTNFYLFAQDNAMKIVNVF